MTTELRPSIVVVGKMNPAIHHPMWYQAIGAVDDATAAKAIRLPGVVVTSEVAQLQLDRLQIQCLRDRWSVDAATENEEQRAFSVTSKVFEALEHTPVTAFGLNFTADRTLEDQTPASVASKKLAGLDVGPANSTAEFESLTLRFALDDLRETEGCWATRLFRSQISLIQGPKLILRVAVNVHHEIKLRGEFGRFDLSRLLMDGSIVRSTVASYADSVFQRIED